MSAVLCSTAACFAVLLHQQRWGLCGQGEEQGQTYCCPDAAQRRAHVWRDAREASSLHGQPFESELHCAGTPPPAACSRHVKQWIASTGAKSAVVVGGGFIGLEMAENLVHLGLETSVVEMLPQV